MYVQLCVFVVLVLISNILGICVRFGKKLEKFGGLVSDDKGEGVATGFQPDDGRP